MAKKEKKSKVKAKALPLPTPTERPRNAAFIKRATDKARERQPKGSAPRFPIVPPTILPGVVPAGEAPAVAMDYNPGVYAYAAQCAGATFDGFPGYPYLANLSTRAEYRAFASTMSTELTRKWIELKSKSDDAAKAADAHKIDQLREEMDRLGVRDLFQKLAEHDCYFGRGQFSINIDGADESLPLVISPKTIKKGSLRSFTAIEPMWTSPSAYNAIDPTAPDFYVPREWFILGKRIHASRLLTITTRPLPDMLKPAFNFSGMSLSQLAEPYVNNWLRTRQSVADLINNFSITTLKTNMDAVLQSGCEDGADSVIARADLFTATRSNLGLMLLDFNNEELAQVNTPLSGLHELQAQSQEHMCVSAGTLVETERGQVEIENLEEGDKVLTRNGYAPVEWVGVTGKANKLVRIESGGSCLLATQEHPVWSEEKQDFVPAQSVSHSTRLRKSPGWASMANQSHGEEGFGAQQKPDTTETQKQGGCCTECCGKPMSGQYLPTRKSTTETKTDSTTHSTTSKSSQEPSTLQSTIQRDGCSACKMQNCTVLSVEESTKQSGLIEQNTAAAHARPERGEEETRTSVVDLDDFVPVYNLKVADGHLPEFYANGILVHNCSVSKIPAMILTGISPSGLNASSDGEIRTFYDWVAAQQQAFWAKPLDTVIKVIMLSLWGEIDPTITYEFCPLWQMSEEEESTIRLNDANADGVLIDRGVISPEDARKRLSTDPNSGYAGIDPNDLPEPPPSEEFDAEGNPLNPIPPEDREEENPINA